MITLIFQIIGAVVAVAIGAAALIAAVGYLFQVVDTWRALLISRAVDHALRKRADQMAYQKFYFQDARLAAMWVCCAKTMAHGEYPDAGWVRDTLLPQEIAKIEVERKK